MSADLSKKATGVVIESHLDPQRGQEATLLLRDGTLKRGDWILAGGAKVKTRILENDTGGAVDEVLDEVAQFYEEDINQVMQNLPAVIEPLLILLLGLGVGGMAVAVIMPMYSLTQAF